MTPVFRPVGDRAVLIGLGEVDGPAVQAAVWSLDRALQEDPILGQGEVIPAIVSLLVTFDPLQTDHVAVARAVGQRIAQPGPARAAACHTVRMRYDGADLEAVALATGLDVDAVISAHGAARFSVAMYGFAPGYAYLSGLPGPLRLPRKLKAKRDVAAGSVIIAGGQCLITTLTMPTGWWVIGHALTPVMDAGAARPFLFEVGDEVRFRAGGEK